MKLKIKFKARRSSCKPQIIKNGDWIDLYADETVELTPPVAEIARKTENRLVKNNSYKIPLGVCMQLPKGYEAVINPRSSLYKNYGCILSNSQGIIDNSYCGDNDWWFAHLICLSKGEHSTLYAGNRILQFRIQLSQKASFWQKFKHLFVSGIKLIEVDKLKNKNRGGFGSTGL